MFTIQKTTPPTKKTSTIENFIIDNFRTIEKNITMIRVPTQHNDITLLFFREKYIPR